MKNGSLGGEMIEILEYLHKKYIPIIEYEKHRKEHATYKGQWQTGALAMNLFKESFWKMRIGMT